MFPTQINYFNKLGTKALKQHLSFRHSFDQLIYAIDIEGEQTQGIF